MGTNNVFLFPSTTNGNSNQCSGTNEPINVKLEIGDKTQWVGVNANRNRKRLATYANYVLGGASDELLKHIGHTRKIHDENYVLQGGFNRLKKVTPVLQIMN